MHSMVVFEMQGFKKKKKNRKQQLSDYITGAEGQEREGRKSQSD